MTALARTWWRDRTPRERVLLAVMMVVLIIVVIWLGVLRPLATARAAAAERLDSAATALADVRAMTGAIRAAESQTRPGRQTPVIERLARSAAEAGLTSERLASDGNGRVAMRIPAVKPAPLLRWLADLEARDRIIVDRIAITRNSDATVAADLAFRDAR